MEKNLTKGVLAVLFVIFIISSAFQAYVQITGLNKLSGLHTQQQVQIGLCINSPPSLQPIPNQTLCIYCLGGECVVLTPGYWKTHICCDQKKNNKKCLGEDLFNQYLATIRDYSQYFASLNSRSEVCQILSKNSPLKDRAKKFFLANMFNFASGGIALNTPVSSPYSIATNFQGVIQDSDYILLNNITEDYQRIGDLNEDIAEGDATDCYHELPDNDWNTDDTQTICFGETWIYQVNASDPNPNQTLTYSDNTPLFDVNSQTGLINYTAQEEDIGTYQITITVDDNSGCINSQDSTSFFLTVEYCNQTLEEDTDNDGVPDSSDQCPGTVLPENVPSRFLWTRHFADINGDGNFETKNHFWSQFTNSKFSLKETRGCSCEQILQCKPPSNEEKYGCTFETINDWIDQADWTESCKDD